MELFSKIKGWVMKILNINTIENAIGTGTLLSAEMRAALELWAEMYAGIAPWHKKSPSCGIEKTLAGTLSQPIGEEIKLAVKNKAIAETMESLNADSYRIIESFVSLGGCVVRPIFSSERLQYEIVPLGNYLPTSYDIDGTLTGAVITKRLTAGKKHYMLVEMHEYKNQNHTVKTRLFETIAANGEIVKEKSLEEIPQTQGLTPEFTWQNVDRPFIIEFRNRETNRIDGSNIPVPLIAGAESMIKDADEQFSRMVWEQEAGKMRIFADYDLFKKIQGTNPEDVQIDPKLKNVFAFFNGDSTDKERIKTHAPTLRTEQQKQAMQEILKRLEQSCNVGKGILSDLEQTPQTATQFLGGRTAFYSKVDTYESELEKKYKACAYVFAYMASAYTGVPFNADVEISYNDLTRKDPIQYRQQLLTEITAGVLNKWEYREQIYGEDEETAKLNTPEAETSGMFGM